MMCIKSLRNFNKEIKINLRTQKFYNHFNNDIIDSNKIT